MRTNITVAISADLAREAKVLAARRGTSLSRLVAEKIEELVQRDREYGAAKRRALRRMRAASDRGWRKPASRDEIHER